MMAVVVVVLLLLLCLFQYISLKYYRGVYTMQSINVKIFIYMVEEMKRVKVWAEGKFYDIFFLWKFRNVYWFSSNFLQPPPNTQQTAIYIAGRSSLRWTTSSMFQILHISAINFLFYLNFYSSSATITENDIFNPLQFYYFPIII